MARQTVVTLTSIPPRFGNLPAKLQSIARQTLRPDRVELTIPKTYRRFPGERPNLPPLPDWVEIFETDHDYGPATKLLPAVRRWRGQDVDLLICDDDRLQDRDWLSRLTQVRKHNPTDILCERGWNIEDRFGLTSQAQPLPRARFHAKGGRSFSYRLARLLTLGLFRPKRQVYATAGYVDVFEGFLGALIPVDVIPDVAFEIPEVIWTVDDVWLSGIAASQGVHIWAHDLKRPVIPNSRVDRFHALRDHVENGVNRDAADMMAVNYMRDTFCVWV